MKPGAPLFAGLSLSLLVTASACDDHPKPPSAPSDASSPASSASTPKPPPSAAPSASAAANDQPTSWSGKYQSAPGSLYVFDGGEWKGVHFRGDDASTGLGEGTLSFTVDPKTGVVRGKTDGAIGDAVVTGAVTGSELSFTVMRHEARDHGLTGTGVGTITASAVTGTMRLSQGDAHVIRVAKFELAKSPP
jgi:hypothetical protein